MISKILNTVSEYEAPFIGDGVKVVLGGRDETTMNKFVPNVNSSKWNDEVFVNLNYRAIEVSDEVESFLDSKIELSVSGTCFKSYTLNENVIEIELHFDSQPESIQFDVLHSPGLRWLYQDELTDEEILFGCSRPLNVIGSYALYWTKYGNKYKTGKFKHLFAWKLTDNNGDELLAKLRYEPTNSISGTLYIDADKKWLDEAAYPIKAMGNGDTIGYSSAGQSDLTNANYNFGPEVTAGSTGEASTIHGYFKNTSGSSQNVKLACLLDSGGTPTTLLSGGSPEISIPANISTPTEYSTAYSGTITNGNLYYCVTNKETTDTIICYDNGTSEYIAQAYASAITGGGSWTDSETYMCSVWVTYSSGTIIQDIVIAFAGAEVVSLDALLKKSIATSTVDIDALLSKSIPVTLSIEAVLQQLKDDVSSLMDSLLNKQDIEIIAKLDAWLNKSGLELSSSVDSILQSVGISVVSAVDALLKKIGLSSTSSLDAVLHKIGIDTEPTSIDGLLKAIGLTSTNALDAILNKSGLTLLSSVDAFLKQTGVTKTTSIDAILAGIGITGYLDALLNKSGITSSTSVDAILFSAADDIYWKDEDVRFKDEDVMWYPASSNVYIAIDAILKEIGVAKTTSLDAILYTVGEQLSIDALLKKIGITSTTALDALTLKRQLKTLTVDAVLSGKQTLQSVLDAVIFSALASIRYAFTSTLTKPSFISDLLKPDFVSIMEKPQFIKQ